MRQERAEYVTRREASRLQKELRRVDEKVQRQADEMEGLKTDVSP
jgi:uncharacterized protein YlxW (UPF0749 family)